MAAPGEKKDPREQSSSPRADRSAKDCMPIDERPEEIEPLDEKSLERVMRDCPL